MNLPKRLFAFILAFAMAFGFLGHHHIEKGASCPICLLTGGNRQETRETLPVTAVNGTGRGKPELVVLHKRTARRQQSAKTQLKPVPSIRTLEVASTADAIIDRCGHLLPARAPPTRA